MVNSEGRASNAQSTKFAVQGLVAAGHGGDWHVDRAVSYLGALQASDGSIRYSCDSDQTPVWVTGQALAALDRKAFPLEPVSGGSGGETTTPAFEACAKPSQPAERPPREDSRPAAGSPSGPR